MKSILIWDYDHDTLEPDKQIIYWRNYYGPNVDCVIIPDILEQYSNDIRELYLAWVYEFGNKKYKNQTIREFLSIQGGFSLWWMSLLVEKCNFSKSPQINDACKLLAFNKWASNSKFCEIKYCGINNELSECIEVWCRQRNVSFKRDKSLSTIVSGSFLKRVYNRLPYFYQAIIWLIYYITDRWKLRGIGVTNWKNSDYKLTFVSYFVNLNSVDLAHKKYGSSYWNDLVGVLSSADKSSNWLHIYMPNTLITNTKKAKEIIGIFNSEKNKIQNHVFLESFLSLNIIFNVVKDWFVLRSKAAELETVLSNSKDNVLNLWPLFKNDWYCSFIGKTSISNIWHFHLFAQAIKCLPKQEKGIYLQENMDWEFAFVYVWKIAGHGDLIGFPHSTIRFWDLRYFFDKRLFNSNSDLPTPNIIAVNGLISKDCLLDSGYPYEMLIDVEALRYNYLYSKIISNGKKVNKLKLANGLIIPLLIVGDIELETNLILINILSRLSPQIFNKFIIQFKPHPLCPISQKDLMGLPIEITTLNLSELLDHSEIVFAGSTTSAALEAYIFEIPVITLLLSNALNLSPLRKMNDGVYFIRNSHEFEKALIAAVNIKIQRKEQNIFYIDPLLPRWKKLLNI
jgi:surface carbohydrate biosynthesis protein (TIGR04326 family)